MLNPDLLFSSGESRNTSRSIFNDLCFESIKSAVFEPEEGLFDAFTGVLGNPLTGADEILQRQKILRDFLSYPHLAESIYSLCEQAEEYKIKIKSSLYSNLPLEERFQEYCRVTDGALELPQKLFDLLRYKSFSSGRLAELSQEVSNAEDWNRLREMIGEAGVFLKAGNLSLDLDFSYGCKLKSARIAETESRIAQKPKMRFPFEIRRGREDAGNEPEPVCFNEMVGFIADQIRTYAGRSVCAMVSDINSAILTSFRNLKYDILFYLAAERLIEYYKFHDLAYCFPSFCAPEQGITASGLYDLSFACFLQKQDSEEAVINNSVSCRDGRFFIVTGPNQGGKTTFLRSIGIAQLLAQAGLPVPAKKYECPAFCGIMTHFPKEEDSNLKSGKLAEELIRLREDVPLVKNGGLVLMNESFATTTAREGAQIATDVIRALSKTGSVLFFVTHLYEFALDIESLNGSLFRGEKAVNLVAQYEGADSGGKMRRTYKIVPGRPSKNVFAKDLFEIG